VTVAAEGIGGATHIDTLYSPGGANIIVTQQATARSVAPSDIESVNK